MKTVQIAKLFEVDESSRAFQAFLDGACVFGGMTPAAAVPWTLGQAFDRMDLMAIVAELVRAHKEACEDPAAGEMISPHGITAMVCGLNFKLTYGQGRSQIHIEPWGKRLKVWMTAEEEAASSVQRRAMAAFDISEAEAAEMMTYDY